MSDNINVTFKCLSCGTDPISLTTDDDVATDDSLVRCKSCGQEFGRYGDVKAKAKEIAAEKLRGMVRDTFKNIKRKFKG
ncbi:hypothetical protein IQ24_03552 [Paracoccus sulfuroxidans]|uniref:Uncharacterized protein n=2 Tax=Paracoccus sulfuroxidans TaxID=384678 RepID=A0A562NC37_9RHOB|nr:hypothetical protein IQ24_03552 [Paracoccus sulfuroxidans]